MDHNYEKIFEHVNSLEIIDTHEHLPIRENDRIKNTDVLVEYLSHYFNSDLISAGLSRDNFLKVVDQDLPIIERWKIVEPYWEISKYTGYGRALAISANALYGVKKICQETIEELNKAFTNSLKPGHFHRVLKEKSRIKLSLIDEDINFGKNAVLNCDKEYFKSVFDLDDFILLNSLDILRNVELETGIKISSFNSWLEACERMFDFALNNSAVALKTHLAYRRSLRYERVKFSEAEDEFNKIFSVLNYPEWESALILIGKNFQDYMMHFILGMANKVNLPVQFHTGIQEGSGNIISNSNPELLINLFLEYRDIDFDIFHIGYPYQQILSVLAKNFPNVFIDMCWAHIISPTASINALVEYLDTVPLNKISAFGGDYAFIDGVYGHQYLARVNVSRALAKKVEDGIFDIDEAKNISEMFFYKNPFNLFKLKDKE